MNVEEECKILLSFSLAVFKFNRNGSSCTPGKADMLNCVDSKRVEGYGPVLFSACIAGQHLGELHGSLTMKIHNCFFHSMCLKGTF